MDKIDPSGGSSITAGGSLPPDNVVGVHHACMAKSAPEVRAAAQKVKDLDHEQIRTLQLLASTDPELRYAMSDCWSIALRAGVEWAYNQAEEVPANPFLATAMQDAGLPISPF